MTRSFGQLSDALRNVNCSEDVEKKKMFVLELRMQQGIS